METRAAVLRAVAEALLPPLPERAEEAAAAGDDAAAALFRHAGASQEVILKVGLHLDDACDRQLLACADGGRGIGLATRVPSRWHVGALLSWPLLREHPLPEPSQSA